MKEAFGILAVSIGLLAGVPYIYSIVKGSTRPHRVSWAIWGVLGTITLISYLAKGAHWSAMLAVAAAVNNLVIFFLSLKFGVGGTSLIDRIALAVGIVGLILWAITDQAAYSLLFALSADAIAMLLTAKKAYESPKSESALGWSIAVIASTFGLLAVQSYNFWQTVYPVYALAGGACLALITVGRRISGNQARLKKLRSSG